jgi:FdhD protein
MNALTEFAVLRPRGLSGPDTVAEEVPVAFEYNGIAHTVMLATPADLEDFALGFSLSEGLVERRSDLYDVEVEESSVGITLKIEIAAESFHRLKERRRSLAGRTGCGLCGAESLNQVMRELAPVAAGPGLPLAALCEGMRRLPERQILQQLTGAVHAACRIDPDGSVSHLREDVGRHNALDKTLGSLARSGVRPGGGLIITSRASFEMVQKAAALGYGVLAAVSAPTAAAVRLAEKLDLTLIGFLRGTDCAIYSHPERLIVDPQTASRDLEPTLMEMPA